MADDISDVIAALRSFIDRRVMPLEDRHRELFEDPTKRYDTATGVTSQAVRELTRQVRMESAEAGFYALAAPESIGGGQFGALAMYRVWVFLHETYGPAATLPFSAVAHWTSGPSFLCDLVSPTVRDEVVPGIVDGSRTGCFAMSEAGGGSDARAMRTRARRVGDEWRLDGEKMWISNGPTASHAFVFAVTDPERRAEPGGGITCFYVPADTVGYTMESVIRLFGHVGGNEAILSFQDVRLTDDHIVGELGRGLDLALRGVSEGRMYNAGRSVGYARWALAKSVEYARTREAFGHPISDYQGISFQLADSAMEIYASDTMATDCARLLDTGHPATTEMAMVKATTTEMAFRVYDRAMQVHGGMGFTNEAGLHHGWHEARIIRMADGSGEIMRRNIARALVKGYYSAGNRDDR